MLPPSPVTVSGPSIPVAVMGPPPESRLVSVCEVTWETVMPPPSAEMVSGPLMLLAWTLPPPELRLAPAASATVIAPPSLSAVTVTFDGTVTANPTLQSDVAHAGAASVSRPADTWSVTAGTAPLAGA
jgi:hypothetical protein